MLQHEYIKIPLAEKHMLLTLVLARYLEIQFWSHVTPESFMVVLVFVHRECDDASCDL